MRAGLCLCRVCVRVCVTQVCVCRRLNKKIRHKRCFVLCVVTPTRGLLMVSLRPAPQPGGPQRGMAPVWSTKTRTRCSAQALPTCPASSRCAHAAQAACPDPAPGFCTSPWCPRCCNEAPAPVRSHPPHPAGRPSHEGKNGVEVSQTRA